MRKSRLKNKIGILSAGTRRRGCWRFYDTCTLHSCFQVKRLVGVAWAREKLGKEKYGDVPPRSSRLWARVNGMIADGRGSEVTRLLRQRVRDLNSTNGKSPSVARFPQQGIRCMLSIFCLELF